MPKRSSNDLVLKQTQRAAFHEQRELLHEVFAQVLEDYALAEAISKGRKSRSASRAEVIRVLKGSEFK
jgi:hypothetical protein